MSYLIDSNILIRYYAEDLPAGAMAFVDRVMENSFNISFINRIEVLGFPRLSEKQISELTESFERSNEYGIDNNLIERSITVARTYNLKAADSIIIATAIQNRFTVITSDTDFLKARSEIEILNPLINTPPESII